MTQVQYTTGTSSRTRKLAYVLIALIVLSALLWFGSDAALTLGNKVINHWPSVGNAIASVLRIVN